MPAASLMRSVTILSQSSSAKQAAARPPRYRRQAGVYRMAARMLFMPAICRLQVVRSRGLDCNADSVGGRTRWQGPNMCHAATPCGERSIHPAVHIQTSSRACWAIALTDHHCANDNRRCSLHPPGGGHGSEACCRGAGHRGWPRGRLCGAV